MQSRCKQKQQKGHEATAAIMRQQAKNSPLWNSEQKDKNLIQPIWIKNFASALSFQHANVTVTEKFLDQPASIKTEGRERIFWRSPRYRNVHVCPDRSLLRRDIITNCVQLILWQVFHLIFRCIKVFQGFVFLSFQSDVIARGGFPICIKT